MAAATSGVSSSSATTSTGWALSIADGICAGSRVRLQVPGRDSDRLATGDAGGRQGDPVGAVPDEEQREDREEGEAQRPRAREGRDRHEHEARQRDVRRQDLEDRQRAGLDVADEARGEEHRHDRRRRRCRGARAASAVGRAAAATGPPPTAARRGAAARRRSTRYRRGALVNSKPNRPLMQRWPSVTDESIGEVTLTIVVVLDVQVDRAADAAVRADRRRSRSARPRPTCRHRACRAPT